MENSSKHIYVLNKEDKKSIINGFLDSLLEEVFNKSIVLFKKVESEKEKLNKDNKFKEENSTGVEENLSELYKIMEDLMKIKGKEKNNGFVFKVDEEVDLVGVLSNKNTENKIYMNLSEVKELIKINKSDFHAKLLNLLDMYGSDYVSN